MNSQLTDITILLDRSGSMSVIREATIGGINTFITDQRAAPGEARLSLVQFDDRYEVNYIGHDIKTAPLLTPAAFVPRGSTALYDAFGRLIEETGARLRAMSERDRPGKVLFVVMTDGQENASRRYTAEQVRSMVRLQTDTYSWEFVYLGANQDAFAVGGMLGFSHNNTITYAYTAGGTDAVFRSLSNNTKGYRSGTATASFTNDDYEKQEELLNGTDKSTGLTR